jgi:glucokinase
MTGLLAADIGATNRRFALFSSRAEAEGAVSLTLRRELWLPGREFPSFSHVLGALLAGADPFFRTGEAESAVFALAGPITGDSCRLSNLPWLIRAQEIQTLLDIPSILLINDFAAQGQACLIPECNEIAVIQEGAPSPEHPAAIIGAGTGLGKALLLPAAAYGLPSSGSCGNTRFLPAALLTRAAASRILSSEGGHAEFPFVTPEEEDFAAFVRRETGCARLIGDTIVTGSGLGHLHAYLTGIRLPDVEASDKALLHPRILEWFARFYARACRNFVLETLALRGLFITGGMALRLPVLTHPAFLPEFRHSAAHHGLLRRVPVLHLQDPRSGLWGAALQGIVSRRESAGASAPVSSGPDSPG